MLKRSSTAFLCFVCNLFCVPLPAVAQDDERMSTFRPQTLTSDTTAEQGYYVAPFLGYGQLFENDAVFTGFRAAWVSDHTFALGMTGELLVNKINALSNNPEPTPAGLSYLGVMMERSPSVDDLTHFDLNLVFGAGRIKYGNGTAASPAHSAPVYVLKPGVTYLVNLSRYSRVGIAGAYLWTFGSNLPRVPHSDFNGFRGELVTEFGTF